jgi:hypothetical protein
MEHQLPTAATYQERADECRRLAKVVPSNLRKEYLKLADVYEQLADKARKRLGDRTDLAAE